MGGPAVLTVNAKAGLTGSLSPMRFSAVLGHAAYTRACAWYLAIRS